jgi:AcrR family transcriptional regulator
MTAPDDPARTSSQSREPGQPRNVRERILTEALRLIAEKGENAMSMRELAQACEVNVAAIYYYFASKDDLFRAVVEERSYGVNLHNMPRPIAEGPTNALREIIVAIWQGVPMEEAIWRILLGESLRNNEAATAQAFEILETAEDAVAEALAEIYPDWPSEKRSTANLVVVNEIFAAVFEQIYRPGKDLEAIRARAGALASLVGAAYARDTGAVLPL